MPKWFNSDRTIASMGHNATVCRAVFGVVPWIKEALRLEEAGMPKKSYTLTFDASPQVVQQSWDCLKRAAAAQEASW
jgi:hypothetical protein